MSCSVSTQLSLIPLVLPVILRQGYFTIQLASMVSLFFSIAHFNRSIKWISSKLAFTVTFVESLGTSTLTPLQLSRRAL